APATLLLAAGFMVASFGGKGLAALACRWFFAYSWLDVGVVFGLTSASAAATLAATFVGFEVGLIGTTAVNAALIVILVSVVLSSLVTEFVAGRIKTQTSEAEKLGSSVVVLIPSLTIAAPAIDVAARLAACDGGVVLPRLACVGAQSTGEPE